MYRVTTPTHTFNLPFEANLIDDLRLTYKQQGKVILEKGISDIELGEKSIALTLTQEETALFTETKAKIQLRIKVGDKVLASNIKTISVNEVLNEEIL